MSPFTPSPEDPRPGTPEAHVAELVRAAARAERAPAALRTRVEALERRPQRPAARRALPRLGFAAALAAAVLAIVLLVPGGTPASPTVAQAAGLALRGPQAPPPGADPAAPGLRLAETVQEIYFPNWANTLGWRATGTRTDRIGGRRAVTVYYRRGSEEIAYTIVSRPALGQPAAAPHRVAGVEVRALRLGARTIVTWRRDGATCVISTRTASLPQLQRLAAWHSASPLD